MPRYIDKTVSVTLGSEFADRAALYVAQNGLGSLETALLLGLVSLVDGKHKEPDKALAHRQHASVTLRLKHLESLLEGVDQELFLLRRAVEHLTHPAVTSDEVLLVDPDWTPAPQEPATRRLTVTLPTDLYNEVQRYAASDDWASVDELAVAAFSILVDWRRTSAADEEPPLPDPAAALEALYNAHPNLRRALQDPLEPPTSA